MERTGDVTATTADTAASPRAVRWFSVGVCGSAVLAGIIAIATGAPLPPIGPVLLLAVAAALCVNRFALFPSGETGGHPGWSACAPRRRCVSSRRTRSGR